MGNEVNYKFKQKVRARKIINSMLLFLIIGYGVYLFSLVDNFILNSKPSYITDIYAPILYYKMKSIFPTESIVTKNSDENAASVPVLLYQGVVTHANGEDHTIKDFREQMFALKQAGYNTVTLEDFYAFTKGEKQLPEKSFLLVFDHNRKDNYYPVQPFLEALDYNAVMFALTDTFFERDVLNDDSPFHLNPDELTQMEESGRWEIQSHGHDSHLLINVDNSGHKGHYLTSKIWLADQHRLESDEEFKQRLYNDLARSKKEVESQFGKEVIAFAYPFGDIGQRSYNIPNAQSIISEVVMDVYPLSFYQPWPSHGELFNYPGNNFIKRIPIDPNWKASDLINVLEKNSAKKVPFSDDFKNDNGWNILTGKAFLGNSLTISSTDSAGFVYLGGSSSWDNYRLDIYIDKWQGKNIELVSKFADIGNYASCDFSNGWVRIKEVTKKQSKLINEIEAVYTLENIGDLGIEINGNKISCLINGEVALTSEIHDLSHGGVGIKVWDPNGPAELILNEAKVSSLSGEVRITTPNQLSPNQFVQENLQTNNSNLINQTTNSNNSNDIPPPNNLTNSSSNSISSSNSTSNQFQTETILPIQSSNSNLDKKIKPDEKINDKDKGNKEKNENKKKEDKKDKDNKKEKGGKNKKDEKG